MSQKEIKKEQEKFIQENASLRQENAVLKDHLTSLIILGEDLISVIDKFIKENTNEKTTRNAFNLWGDK